MTEKTRPRTLISLTVATTPGVDVIDVRGASVCLYYEGQLGDTVEQHAGGIKTTLPF